MMDSKTDEEIVEMTREGEPEAYTELVRRYQDKLLRYTGSIIKNNEMAEDAVQNTFIKAYENLQGFNTGKKFSSWIYRIAHNEAVNKIKKNERKSPVSLKDLFEEFLESKVNIEQEYEKKELDKNVRRCLQKLPIKYADVLALFYIENKSYEEISDILRIPTGTVGTRINRGKNKLKETCIKLKIKYD